MYLIRPAVASDRDDVVSMIQARAHWLRDHGHQRWSTWSKLAHTLGDQTADPDWPVWVLLTSHGSLVGCTTTETTTPDLAWTEPEQAEPAVFLQSTVTHPDHAGQGLGALIAYWALDHAARHDKKWVRRGVLTTGTANRGLVRYYRWQGWDVVRTIPHPRKNHVDVWSLQRPAESQPDITGVVTDQTAESQALATQKSNKDRP